MVISSFAGEALGVKYDQLYLVRLKASHKKVDHQDLLIVGDKQPKIALETFKVTEQWSKRIDEMDLYASNRKGYHSMSSKQKDDFLHTLFFIMGRCEKAKLP